MHEKNSRVRLSVLGHCHPQRFFVNSSNHSDTSRNGIPRTLSLSFFVGFSLSAGPRDGSPRTLSMPLVLSLLVDAGCCVGVTASCGKDVGDAGAAELEEPVDRPGTTSGTYFAVLHFIRLPFLMSCGF